MKRSKIIVIFSALIIMLALYHFFFAWHSKPPFPLISITVGINLLVSGIGFLRRKLWARRCLIYFASFYVVLGIVSIVALAPASKGKDIVAGMIPTLIIYILILCFLNIKSVKEQFKQT